MNKSEGMIGWDEQKTAFINYLASLNYSASALSFYRFVIRQLDQCIQEYGEASYEKEIGERYVKEMLSKSNPGLKHKMTVKMAVRRLDDFIEGHYSFRTSRSCLVCPVCFQDQLNAYYQYLILHGKRESTTKVYCSHCGWVLREFYSSRIRDLSLVQPRDIWNVIEKSKNKASLCTALKGFLKYAFKAKLHLKDLSVAVPSIRRPKPVPSVYSAEETGRLLSSIDTDANMGKRDYAIVLLALRLGMRAGDIVKLEFRHIDSRTKTITFVQEKTQEPQNLALTPELEAALAAYAMHGRSNSGSTFIFLRSAAPFAPISRSSVGNIVRKYLKLAGIQPAGRKSGPHSLRMTLASELVYEKVPFEVVKKIMGHKDQNVLKHYVEFDVEMLRTCSLETPAPTGGFLERMSLYEGRGGCYE